MRRWVILLGALTLLAAVALAGFVVAGSRDEGSTPGAAPAAATVGPLPAGVLTVGLEDDQLPVAGFEQIPSRLERLKQTGIRLTRVDVLWNDVAPRRPRRPEDPNDPAYIWARYDHVLDGLAKRGIEAILTVYRTPEWANGGHGVEWAPAPADLGAFTRALATRYDGATADREGHTHARVRMFEPWNEPNLAFFLRPQWSGPPEAPTPASPSVYAAMLRAAYAGIKAAQPSAIVIGVSGGPVGRSRPPRGSVGIVDFVRALAALHPPMDAYSQHLYPAGAPDAVTHAMPSFATLPDLLHELDALKPGAPLLITEFGYTTAPSEYRATYVGTAEQAAYLPRALARLAAMPRVRAAIWFNLQDNAGWPSGLIDAAGTAKQSWATFLATPKSIRSGPGP